MSFRKISADWIFDGLEFLGKEAVVVIRENGEIETITNKSEAGNDVEHFNGIVSPGFINSHCHLELSHMKGVIPPETGLVDFLINVVKKRGQLDETFILQRIKEAETEMYENGIVGVGDISNTDQTLVTKKHSAIKWHNLVEVLNFFNSSLTERLAHNERILKQFQDFSFSGSLTPHAPYTVSEATFKAINEATKNSIVSIHNQETAAENELFKSGNGDFLRLYSAVGMEAFPFKASGKTSLQTFLPYFDNGQTIVLVHNTFIKEEDVVFAHQLAKDRGLNIAYCLCPNANLYIENVLPPADLLIKHNATLLLGTDSYSSNWQLSIAKEIQTIQNHFPHIPLEEILRWATSNGAKVFGWEKLGWLQKGKQPGLVLLDTDGQDNLILTGTSKRII